MKRLFYFSFGLLFLVSCGHSTNDSNVQQIKTDQSKQIEKEINIPFKILSEVKNINSPTNKCNIDIELKEKISKEDLILIANKLRETRKSYDNLWIFYYLPEMKVGSGAWATSHFTPELKVDILGTTIEEEAKLKNAVDNVNGNIIGRFYEQEYTSATYVVYEKNNKIFIKVTYKDNSSSNDEMKKKNVSKGIRLDYKEESSNGEYFILTKSEVLEFYNAENKKFTVAQKIK